jgi:hypothetical protein
MNPQIFIQFFISTITLKSGGKGTGTLTRSILLEFWYALDTAFMVIPVVANDQ